MLTQDISGESASDYLECMKKYVQSFIMYLQLC